MAHSASCLPWLYSQPVLIGVCDCGSLQGGEGTGMASQDRPRQPSGAEEAKAVTNENDCPICSPLFHDSDRQGEEEREDRGLSRQPGKGYLRQGSQARVADWATAPPPSWHA